MNLIPFEKEVCYKARKLGVPMKLSSLVLLCALLFASTSSATTRTAFNKLDSAVSQVMSARGLLIAPRDFRAADNNLRKAGISVTKALSEASKGSSKLRGKDLTTYKKAVGSVLAYLATGRTAIKKRKALQGINAIEKAIKQFEIAMRLLRSYPKNAGESSCIGTFSVEALNAPEVYQVHLTVSCPFIFDLADAIVPGGDIGSLSYGYANFGGANAFQSACSYNNGVLGECGGLEGRPGGTYAMRVNVTSAEVPASAFLSIYRFKKDIANFHMKPEGLTPLDSR